MNSKVSLEKPETRASHDTTKQSFQKIILQISPKLPITAPVSLPFPLSLSFSLFFFPLLQTSILAGFFIFSGCPSWSHPFPLNLACFQISFLFSSTPPDHEGEGERERGGAKCLYPFSSK